MSFSVNFINSFQGELNTEKNNYIAIKWLRVVQDHFIYWMGVSHPTSFSSMSCQCQASLSANVEHITALVSPVHSSFPPPPPPPTPPPSPPPPPWAVRYDDIFRVTK